MANESGGGSGSARGIRAGAAYVELNGKDNTAGFFSRMKQKFAGFLKTVGAVALAGLGAGLAAIPLLVNPLLDTIQDLGKIQNVADAFGVTGKAASGLFGVLGAAGGEFKENLEGVIQFSQTVNDAVNGVGEQGAKLFAGLGVTAKDISKLPIDEQFYSVLGAIRQLPQPLQEAKLALLGGTDSMKQWQALLSMSEADVRSLADKLAFSNTELRQAADASKAYQAATLSVSRAWQQIAVGVAPTVKEIAGWVEKAADGFTAWIKGRSAGNLLEELWVRAKIGAQETIIFLRDGLTSLWQTFTSGDNFEKFSSAVWQLVKSVVGYVIGSLSTAIPIVTRGLTELVKNMLMASATIKLAAGDEAGAKQDVAAAVMMTPELMRDALQKAMAADAAEFDRARGKLNELGDDLAKNFAASAKANEVADAKDREILNAELKRVLDAAEVQQNTAAFAEHINDLMRPDVGGKVADNLERVSRAFGTFGDGSFLSQGFGVQSADDVNKKLDKGNKLAAEGNELLGKIEKKVGPQKFQ